MHNFGSDPAYRESYSLEIIHKPAEDGLTRPGMVKTKVEGIRDLDDVKELRYMFSRISGQMPGSDVKVGRHIMFYCHACQALIGEKTIPLRVEPFRRDVRLSVETETSIHVEQYRCLNCGHHTRYNLQDPILSVY
ncbi:MAG: hypothetical protein DRH97_03575 [Chloroflexi bacterium]|nr:MAG: hypothetical protein DRH97_03575 [Chloroflexota bacterium]